jgi:hypothetical protein
MAATQLRSICQQYADFKVIVHAYSTLADYKIYYSTSTDALGNPAWAAQAVNVTDALSVIVEGQFAGAVPGSFLTDFTGVTPVLVSASIAFTFT